MYEESSHTQTSKEDKNLLQRQDQGRQTGMNQFQPPSQDEDDDWEEETPAALPDIPSADLTLDFSLFKTEQEEKIQKRASNVMKLAEENEKLKAELKAMTDRLEAAERRRKALAEKEQRIMEEGVS